VLRNAAYLLFTANDQVIRTSYSTRSLPLFGTFISVNRLAVLGLALVIPLGLHLFLFAHLPRQSHPRGWLRTPTAVPWSAWTWSASMPSLRFGYRARGAAGLLSATLFSFNPAFGAGEL